MAKGDYYMCVGFIFRCSSYGIGTIVRIHANEQNKFNYNTMLCFKGIDHKNGLYRFESLYDNWQSYCLTEEEIAQYIVEIIQPCGTNNIEISENKKADQDYIEGMLSAWIWYILIMIGAMFIKGFINIIGLQIAASIIFWSWRLKKIKGE